MSRISMAVAATASVISTGAAFVVPSSALVWLPIIKDFVVMVGTIAGASVAVLGLTTWQRQLKGQTEYDLAKRLLHVCYRYRDSVAGVRHPLMGGHEMPLPPDDEAAQKTEAQKRFYGLQKAYESRWERVRDARADLYPELLEAEVLWGKELSDLCKPLFQLELKLALATRDELTIQNPDVSPFQKKHLEPPQSSDVRFRLIYSTLSDDDEYATSFQKELDRVADYLKKHLKR